MHVIGVIDLLGGRAVHARGGNRACYQHVLTAASECIDGEAVTLGRTYLAVGVSELYVADLDAIDAAGALTTAIYFAGSHESRRRRRRAGHVRSETLDNATDGRSEPRTQRLGAAGLAERAGFAERHAPLAGARSGQSRHDALIPALASLGAAVWLDAGISSPEQARHVLALGASQVVVGLETLTSFDALADICSAVRGDRVAFSLDLRGGEPIVATSSDARLRESPETLAARAASAGAEAIIVIDLARVGTSTGLDLDLLARVRRATPGLTLVAGGGVRGPDDLADLARAGCDAALVATALHDGHLSARDLTAQGRPE